MKIWDFKKVQVSIDLATALNEFARFGGGEIQPSNLK